MAEHPGQALREARRPCTGRCPSCAVSQEVQASLYTFLHSSPAWTGILRGQREKHLLEFTTSYLRKALVLDSTDLSH